MNASHAIMWVFPHMQVDDEVEKMYEGKSLAGASLGEIVLGHVLDGGWDEPPVLLWEGKEETARSHAFGPWSLKLEGFSGGSDSKESTCNAGDLGSIPGSVRPPGEGSGYPLQYSYLGSSMDRGTWQNTAHGGCKGLDMTEWLTPSLFPGDGLSLNPILPCSCCGTLACSLTSLSRI